MDSMETPRIIQQSKTSKKVSGTKREQDMRKSDGMQVHPHLYASLTNTFKVSTMVQPKVFNSSATLNRLTKPKFKHSYRRPVPFMHSDFRGLLVTDYQETVTRCMKPRKTKHAKNTDVNSTTDSRPISPSMKIENGVVTLRQSVTQ